MKEEDNQSSKKCYRLVQPEGKISWRIEELWEGGIVRSPFGNREAAKKREEDIARAEGFIDDLELVEIIEQKMSHKDAFKKDSEGNWKCTIACSIEMENKEIVFTEGQTIGKGILYLGVDVAKWLDENS